MKRGSHLSAQGQQSCSGQPHCASLIVKNLRDSVHPFDLDGAIADSQKHFIFKHAVFHHHYAVFHYNANAIYWTAFILQYATYVPRCKNDRSDWSGRSHLARCREVVNNSVKGSNLTTSREYFHEIFSRLRIINSMPVLSPSNSML